METQLSHEHRLTEVEARSKSNCIRLDELEKRTDNMEKLVTSVAVMAEKLNSMETNIGDMKSVLQKLTEKPAKRWDSIVDKILLLVVAAVVAFILAKIGL